MATISNTPRPGYVFDVTDNVWYPIGVGGHDHGEIQKIIVDAKGDLIAGTAADTVARLAVGTNGQVLTADSSEATGLKYATPAAGAFTLIQRSSFSNVAGTSTTFDGVFTSTYKSYLVSIEAISTTTGGDDFQLQFIASGTTRTTSYYGSSVFAVYTSTSVASFQTSNASQGTLSEVIGEPGGPGRGFIFFNGVGNTSEKPQYNGQFVQVGDMNVFGGGNNSANTYTGFLFKSSSANVTGTVAVYGLATS